MVENRFSSQHGMSDRSRELVSEYPTSSLMLAFGVGFGVGILIASAFAEESTPARRKYTEQFGRQMLDALSKIIPEAVSSRLG